MSRKLKFRAWSNRDKCWCGAFSIHMSGLFRDGDIWQSQEEADVVIMQYTGINDKNGVEIYEGDIIRRISKCSDYGKVAWDYNAEIVYDEECMMFEFKKIKDNFKALILIVGDEDTIEVIGNIYENKSSDNHKRHKGE